MSPNLPNDKPSPRPTDSPWFWISVFLSGALIALVLAAPKYSWRQPQIERQFQARERSGRTVSARGGPQPLSTTNLPLLSLRPLAILLAAVLVAAGVAFWLIRWKHAKNGHHAVP